MTLLLSVFFFLFISSVNSLIIILIIQTLIGSAAIPVWMSILGDHSTARTRGAFIGKITGFGALASILMIIIAGGWMNRTNSEGPNQYRIAFILSCLCFLGSVTLILGLKESLIVEKTQSKPLSIMKILRQSPSYRRFVIIESIFFFAMSIAWPLFSFVTKNIVHATNAQISVITTINMITMAGAMRIAGSVSDMIGRKPVLITSRLFLFVVPLLYALSGKWPHWSLLAIASVFGGVSGGLAVPTKNALALDLAPKEHMASFSGIFVMFTGITSFIGALVGGLLTQLFSLSMGEAKALILMMFLAAIIRLVASLGYFFLKETAPSKADQYKFLEK